MTSPGNITAEAVPVSGEPEEEEPDGRKKHRHRRKSRSKRKSSAGRASDAPDNGDSAASVPGNTASTTAEPVVQVPASESTSTIPAAVPESARMTPGEASAQPPQPSALKLEENRHPAQLALPTNADHPPSGQVTATFQAAVENQAAAVSQDSGPKGSTDLGKASRGFTPESLKLMHPVLSLSSSKRSDTADKATNTASWLELSHAVASSSDSLTSEKYTQTGDIVMYPRKSASGRRRPQMTKSAVPPKFEHDDSECEDTNSSFKASSGVSSQPSFSEEADYSEDIVQLQIPELEALGQDYDFESTRELSCSEGALSFALALKEKGLRETRAAPGFKNRTYTRTDASPPSRATQSTKKKGRTTRVRQEHSGFDHRRESGQLSKASAMTTGTKPNNASLLDVEACDDDVFYEEIPVETQNNESGSPLCFCNSGEGDEVSLDQSDVTRPALPTSMNENQQGSCKVFSLGAVNERTNDQENECELIQPQPLQGSLATRRTTDGTKERGALTNEQDNAEAPLSEPTCIHCARNRTAMNEALTQRGRFKSSANNRENCAPEISAAKTPEIYVSADPLLCLPPYKVGRRPIGCICDGIEYLPQRPFSYALPNSYLQYRQSMRVGQVQPTSAVQGPSQIFSGQRLPDTAAIKSKPGNETTRDGSLGRRPPYVRNINFQAITRRRPPVSTKISNNDIKEDARETMTSVPQRSKETSPDLPYYSTNNHDKGRVSEAVSSRTCDRNDRSLQALKKASTAASHFGCKVQPTKPPGNSKRSCSKECDGLKAKSTKHQTLNSKPRGRSRCCSSCECKNPGHHCDNGGTCRPGRIFDAHSSRPEDSRPAPGHSTILARLEELLREETRLLKEGKERHEERLRLEQLVKERGTLLSELRCGANNEGQEIQDALSLHTAAVTKAFAFLNMEPSAGAGTVNGHQATKGAISATKQVKSAPTGKEKTTSDVKTISSSSSSRKDVRKAKASRNSSKHDVEHKKS